MSEFSGTLRTLREIFNYFYGQKKPLVSSIAVHSKRSGFKSTTARIVCELNTEKKKN